MPFLKAALVGSYQGQAIVNVLYYGADDFTEFPAWSPELAADLGATLLAELVPEYLPPLPSTYTLHTIDVSAVDERGVVVSDFVVPTTVEDPGGTATNSEGQAQVAIISFQTRRFPTAGRTVKRSYWAYGPLHDSSQASDGSLEATYITGLVDLLAVLMAPLDGPTFSYAPVRVGRTAAPEAVAVGYVSGITLRPYASFRKSRKRRPSGL
jgi:hypothetical protein